MSAVLRLIARMIVMLWAAWFALPQPEAEAQPAPFYRGKQVVMLIASGAGGGYDAYARALARHMGRHIPGNPTIVPKNTPGAGGLIAAAAVFAVATILASAGMYAFEHEAQPDKFASIPAAMYWAVVTLTTLGYGDIVPVTTGGRIFTALVATSGIGMVAFPSAILASGFVRQLRLHRHDVRGSGVAAEVRRLGLSKEDAARLVDVVLRDAALQICPSCNEPLEHGRHVSSRFAP